MVYLKSVENVITLGKLIGLLFLFCLPLLSILFLKTKRNDLARPVTGTIFLVVKAVGCLRNYTANNPRTRANALGLLTVCSIISSLPRFNYYLYHPSIC